MKLFSVYAQVDGKRQLLTAIFSESAERAAARAAELWPHLAGLEVVEG